MKTTFVITRQAFQALTDWCRSMCYLVFGPTEGERRFRRLRVIDVIPLWLGNRPYHQS
jgi:hypothetical protein